MIGPVRSYEEIYVALCGRQFVNWSLGRQHEVDCLNCNAALAPEDNPADDVQPTEEEWDALESVQ